MNINYYEKKSFYFAQQKINILLITNAGQSADLRTNPRDGTRRARKLNSILNYGTDQPDIHFAG